MVLYGEEPDARQKPKLKSMDDGLAPVAVELTRQAEDAFCSVHRAQEEEEFRFIPVRSSGRGNECVHARAHVSVGVGVSESMKRWFTRLTVTIVHDSNEYAGQRRERLAP